MSYFYVKNGEPFIPEKINPELARLAKAIVKTCHLNIKLQMKSSALNNALKSGDKEQMASIMFRCLEKNRLMYNQDMSLTGVKIEQIDDSFFADKDVEFYKAQLSVLIDFAAINTVVEGKMMPLMSAACEKTLNKPINKILFFSNQLEILEESEAEDAAEQE